MLLVHACMVRVDALLCVDSLACVLSLSYVCPRADWRAMTPLLLIVLCCCGGVPWCSCIGR